jgi:hypothetical protein
MSTKVVTGQKHYTGRDTKITSMDIECTYMLQKLRNASAKSISRK